MKKFDLVKTIQLIMLIAITVTALVLILRDPDLYALIATDRTAKARLSLTAVETATA